MMRITPTSSNADLRLAVAELQEKLTELEEVYFGSAEVEEPELSIRYSRGWRPYGDGSKFWLDPGNTMRRFPDEIPKEILQAQENDEEAEDISGL